MTINRFPYFYCFLKTREGTYSLIRKDVNFQIFDPPKRCGFCTMTCCINMWNSKLWSMSKGEDTLWNISFRPFHETQFNVYFITLHYIWFHEIHIKYVKKKPPRLRKKEFKRSLRPATLLKKRLWRRCFPVNFAKFLRTPF